jgi:hypothetical protein
MSRTYDGKGAIGHEVSERAAYILAPVAPETA